jgi:inner membrane protein
VGPWRQGLILEQAGQLRSVGTGEADRLYPIRAQLIEGEPLRVIAQRVDMRGRSLGWLSERLTPRQTHFISGELRLGGHPTAPVATPARYQPVRIDGQRLRLRYARPQDLQLYRDRVAIEGMLYVQLWLKPGEAAVALRLGGERQDSDPIPEALKPFL